MTPYLRVHNALHGLAVDKVPFTTYTDFVKHDEEKQKALIERGLCVVRRTNSWKEVFRDTKVTKEEFFTEKGSRRIRTVWETPHGTLTSVVEPSGNTVWVREYPFKSPDDYPALRALFSDRHAVDNYDHCKRILACEDENHIIRDNLPLEPMQTFLSGNFMSPEDFSLEWYDNRDEILALVAKAARFNAECYPICAAGPLEIVNYGGNVIPEITSPAVFREYYVPYYHEACEILHRTGKLVGCHYDADIRGLMDDIAATPLDYIETYDPGAAAPLSEAFAKFPDKVLWLNFPSSWHSHDADTIRKDTLRLITEADGHPKFIIGVTEDPPVSRTFEIYGAIMDGIDLAASAKA